MSVATHCMLRQMQQVLLNITRHLLAISDSDVKELWILFLNCDNSVLFINLKQLFTLAFCVIISEQSPYYFECGHTVLENQ